MPYQARMADKSFIQRHLSEAEDALVNYKQKRRELDRLIEVLEQVVQIERGYYIRKTRIPKIEKTLKYPMVPGMAPNVVAL